MAASVIPRDEINILLLGETGTGKSTFINAFANYFKFDSLDDAIAGEIDVLITSTFTLTNENYEIKTIKVVSDEDEYGVVDRVSDVGKSSTQEHNVGESSTQECDNYVFHADNKLIRLIDTPGIGDTRGIEFDKKNFENILKNISQHEYLNGICILLKPNVSRLSILFKFCIQELLSHLHKSAKDNIVFCLTNTRGTFFRPGDTLPVLQRQLQELKENFNIEIKICNDIIYCFDNEPFRFLAAKKKGIIFPDDQKRNFVSSWEKSSQESVRLLQYITNRTPHKIADTISLNNARQTIMIFREPLAEIDRNIQENIAEIRKLKVEIQNADLTGEELRNKLYFPYIKLKIIPLDRPRVVCKNSNCQAQNIDCHVKWKASNIFILKLYGTMIFGKCKPCGCTAKNHKIIFYKSISEYTKIIDEYIEYKISINKIDQIYKQDCIDILEKQIDQLKKQQNIVGEIIPQFAQFLKQNAIAVYNDAYVEYLDHIIRLERQKASTSENYNNKILEGLDEVKRIYNERMKIIEEMIKDNDPASCSLSPEDIIKLENKLYNLPNFGNYLRTIKKEEERAFKYQERHYKFSENALNVLKKIFNNQ